MTVVSQLKVSPAITPLPGEGRAASAAGLSICVPTYRDDPSALIHALAALDGAAQCELLVYDDGTNNAEMTAAIEAAMTAYPGPARLLTATTNSGRSAARNRLIEAARSDWVLLLDADMLPDSPEFLQSYLATSAARPKAAVIAGGFSLQQVRPGADQKLHAAQARASDCIPAVKRKEEPGRFLFTSNIAVHKDVLKHVTFDEQFTGWGWEDVDWGLRVAGAFPIFHIDNTASHLGLEPDDALVRKFGTSGKNYARLVKNHPDAARRMKLTGMARLVKGWPLVANASRAIALQRKLPLSIRVVALKLYRARMYADEI